MNKSLVESLKRFENSSPLFRKILGATTVNAIVKTAVTRGVVAAGGILLLAVLGWLYGAEGVGIFALAESLALAGRMIGSYGTDSSLMRFVGRDPFSVATRTYVKYALLSSFIRGSAVGLLIFVTRGSLSDLLNAPGLGKVVVGFAAATPILAITFVLSGFLKAIGQPARTSFMQNSAVAGMTAVGLLLMHWVSPSAGVSVIGSAYFMASVAVCSAASFFTIRWLKLNYSWTSFAKERVGLVEFKRSSSAFFVSNASTLVSQSCMIWIIGYLFLPNEVGEFKAAQQVSLFVAFILTIINTVLPPKFARLYYAGKKEELESLAQLGVVLGGCLAIIPLAICLLIPDKVLDVFGHGLSRGDSLLRVLIIGQFIHVAMGSVGYLLNMAGYERIVKNISIAASVTVLISVWALYDVLGIQAAALAVAAGVIINNLACAYFVHTRLGIRVLPSAKILNILRMKG